MPRHDVAALKRLEKYGYIPAKDRTDTCNGCEHSSPCLKAVKTTLKCRRVGTSVSAGAKCDEWKAKVPAAVCAPGSKSDRLKSISNSGTATPCCTKEKCDKVPLVQNAFGWRCPACKERYDE